MVPKQRNPHGMAGDSYLLTPGQDCASPHGSAGHRAVRLQPWVLPMPGARKKELRVPGIRASLAHKGSES